MLKDGMQLVTVYGAIAPRGCPARYSGVTWIADKGETLVTVNLPYGVKQFSKVPCIVQVPVENTFVEFHDNERPILIVNSWQPFYD